MVKKSRLFFNDLTQVEVRPLNFQKLSQKKTEAKIPVQNWILIQNITADISHFNEQNILRQ